MFFRFWLQVSQSRCWHWCFRQNVLMQLLELPWRMRYPWALVLFKVLSVCRARASSTRILPPLERSISARAALARRICIRQFKFDRDQNQNTIVRNDRSRFPLTVRALLRWNAQNAARAPPRTKGAIRVHDSAVLETALESPVWVFLASLSGIWKGIQTMTATKEQQSQRPNPQDEVTNGIFIYVIQKYACPRFHWFVTSFLPKSGEYQVIDRARARIQRPFPFVLSHYIHDITGSIRLKWKINIKQLFHRQ